MAAPNVEELERQFNTAMEEAETGTTLEAIRRLYGEFDSEDPEAVSAIVHPKLEIEIRSFFLDGRSYKGVKGFVAWRDRDGGDLRGGALSARRGAHRRARTAGSCSAACT